MWKSALFCLLLSICYLAGVGFYLDERLHELSTMPLNELGDFLAGVFGSLAFLFLLLGFLQQRIALLALFSQNKSLTKSVADQEAMLTVARDTFQSQILEREMQAEPFIEVEYAKPDDAPGSVKLRITNHSTICESVRCVLEYPKPEIQPQIEYFDYLVPNKTVVIDMKANGVPKQGVALKIQYKKITGKEGSQRFYLRNGPLRVGGAEVLISKFELSDVEKLD